MAGYYNYIKALHLIFIVTWFAGLFYIVRIFIYQIEAHDKPSPEKEIIGKQLKLMANRLWFIITWPSAILTLIFASTLISIIPGFLEQPWMKIKLCFVASLYLYHFKCHQIYKQLQNDIVKHSSTWMRIFNEIATIILFAVVFLVIVRHEINWIYGVLGIISLSILIMLFVKLYKKLRSK